MGDEWHVYVHWVAVIIAAVTGLVKLLFGYRVCKVGVALHGFLMFALPTNCLLLSYTSLASHTVLLISVGVGIIFGLIFAFLYKYFMWTYGVSLGFVLSGLVLAAPYMLERQSEMLKTENTWAVIGSSVVVFSILATQHPKGIAILSTATGGALSLVAVVDHYAETGLIQRFYFVLAHGFHCNDWFGFVVDKEVVPIHDDESVYLMAASWAFASLSGFLIQSLLTAKTYHHRRRRAHTLADDWEREPLLQQPPPYEHHDPPAWARNGVDNNNAAQPINLA